MSVRTEHPTAGSNREDPATLVPPAPRVARGKARVAGHRRARPRPQGPQGPLGPLGPTAPAEEVLDGDVLDADLLDARDRDAGDRDAGDLDAGDLDAGDLDAGDLDAGEERTAAAPARPTGRRTRVLVAALAGVTVVAAGTAGWLWHAASRADAAAVAGPAALAAARSAAPAVLSYDYRHLDQDFAAASRHLTGPFKSDYAQTTTKVVTPTATKYHATVKADVVAASVVDATPERVTVLLYVDQTTTSDRVDGPKVDLDRVRMTLVPVGGQWLVDGVTAL